MKTVGEARVWLKENLKPVYNLEELNRVVFLLLNSITKLSQTQLHVFPEKELTEEQTKMLFLSAQKLQTGMPVQYVLGETQFFGLTFEVDPSVLIPRPETEELVSWVLEEKVKGERLKGERLGADKKSGDILSGGHEEPVRILDIGTGSGCIPISIKKNWPKAEVFGLDVSQAALETAQKNALLNQVEVGFFQQDISNFMPLKEASAFSIIVSNPPYIIPKEQKLMHNNVLGFEPHQALFVPENNPLLFYRAIAAYASFTLQKNGLLFFEINENFGKEVVELLRAKDFTDVILKKDFCGKDRMVRGVKV